MACKGTGHWDGSYGGMGGHDNVHPFENHQDHVFDGHSQHRLKEHQTSAGLGDLSADELSKEADAYLRLIPDGKSRPHSP